MCLRCWRLPGSDSQCFQGTTSICLRLQLRGRQLLVDGEVHRATAHLTVASPGKAVGAQRRSLRLQAEVRLESCTSSLFEFQSKKLVDVHTVS